MRLPDFIIAGAPRSGTTWLYRLLERHPGVAMASPVNPEPKFFLADERYERGLEHYAATWFESLPDDAIVGEKSTNYLESEVAARRIREDLPEVRLLFSLREPADRAWSNYLWTKSNGLESLSFCEALEREEEREANYTDELRYARPHSYRSRGLYAALLQPWFRLFPREQILCLCFEDIAGDPESVASRVHRFLEVEERRRDAVEQPRVNATKDVEEPPACLAELRRWYADANRELADLVGWSHAWQEDHT